VTAATWHVRPYEDGDEVGLTALWGQVFGRPMTPEHWRWKLKGRPAPIENVWVAAASDGRVIGQYAGIAAELKLAGKLARGVVIVDSMTHPDFRRQGVLATLTQRAHEAWAEAGVAIVMGLPNERAQTSLADWQPSFRLRRSRLVLRLDEVVSRARRVPPPVRAAAAAVARLTVDARRRGSWPEADATVLVRPIEAGVDRFPGAALDALWESLSPHFENAQVRNADWWRWRFLDRPASPYLLLAAHVGDRMTGAAAYRFEADDKARRGTLCELLVAPDDGPSAAALTSAVLRDLWELRAGTVVALAPERGALEERLHAIGFGPQPAAFDVMYVVLNPAQRQGVSNDSKAWHMSGADFDVV
jgi:hypothetical protein